MKLLKMMKKPFTDSGGSLQVFHADLCYLLPAFDIHASWHFSRPVSDNSLMCTASRRIRTKLGPNICNETSFSTPARAGWLQARSKALNPTTSWNPPSRSQNLSEVDRFCKSEPKTLNSQDLQCCSAPTIDCMQRTEPPGGSGDLLWGVEGGLPG